MTGYMFLFIMDTVFQNHQLACINFCPGTATFTVCLSSFQMLDSYDREETLCCVLVICLKVTCYTP